MSGLLRRDFLKAGAAGLVAATAPAQLAGLRSATPADLQGLVGDGRKRRILLRGGAVLSLDARVGDFEKAEDRKSTRLNSSHSQISYAVFCLKKKKKDTRHFRADMYGV